MERLDDDTFDDEEEQGKQRPSGRRHTKLPGMKNSRQSLCQTQLFNSIPEKRPASAFRALTLTSENVLNGIADECSSILLECEDSYTILTKIYSILDMSAEQIAILDTLNTTEFPNDEFDGDISKNEINAASFPQLILYLTSPELPNLEFQRMFLLTFPSFSTPSFVLAAIFTRYYADPNEYNSNINDTKKLKQTRDRIVRFLSTWMKLTPYQFDDSMINAIRWYVDGLKEKSEKDLKAMIIEGALNHLKGIKNNVEITVKLPIPPSILPTTPPDTWTLDNIDPCELARQISIYHNEVFIRIGPMELLTAAWGSKKGGGSPNLHELTRHFDFLTRYIQRSILKGDDAITRGRTFKRWVDVARNFKEQQNYHGLFTVMCALTHKCISRLHDTMKKAMKTNKDRKKAYDEMCKICDFSNDYATYRPIIMNATNACVPFIGCFQRDLIYVQEGFPNLVKGLLNIKKSDATMKLIMTVQRFQNDRYSFKSDPTIQNLVRHLDEMDLPDTIELMRLSISKEKKK